MKKVLSLVFGLCMAMSMFAQEAETDTVKTGKSQDRFNIGVYVGPNYSCNENLDSKHAHNIFCVNKNTISFGGLVVIGKEFSNLWGWRASAGLFGNKGRANYYDQAEYMGYNFNDAEVFGDLTFDLTDWLAPNRKNAFSLKAFLGVGGAYAWGYPENSEFVKPHESFLRLDGKDPAGFHIGGRLGLNATWRLSDVLRLGVELSSTLFDDKFNGYKSDWAVDTRQDLLVGLVYTIPGKKKVVEPAPIPEPVVIPEPEPEPVVIPEPEPEPEPIITPKILEELTIPLHFQIRESNILSQHKERIQKLVDFVNAHKTTKITVKGYADAQTGNPKINVGYSKSRAEKTTAELIKIFNISPDKIETTWYGDTVQPFAENDLNRCAILSVKEVE